jgi:DNA-directed RNA polymerase specialized sigma24 family protein
VPPESAHAVFDRTDWTRLMPQLLEAAAGCLRVVGWAEGEGHAHFMLQSQELVNEAVKKCLAGDRRLTPAACASEEGLVAFVCETMRSIAVNRCTSAAARRRASDEELDEKEDDAPSPSRRLAAHALLQRIEEALQGDEEALAVHRAIEDGHTDREAIAKALGWTVPLVKTVRRRMSRRLARMGIKLHEEGENEAPASSPEGPT